MELNNNAKPLVSVVVITYNSAAFIEETLDSISRQTYSKLELIITDDGSADSTITKCQSWLQKNEYRFVSARLVIAPANTGTPANCNRGVQQANGTWIKLIAGDDLLLPGAIESYLAFTTQTNFSFVTAAVEYFTGETVLTGYGNKKALKKFFSFPSAAQRCSYYLKHNLFINSPAYFYKRQVYDQIGGYDEAFRVLEDNPFVLRALMTGADIGYLETVCVRYRINAASATGSGSLLNKDLARFHTKYAAPELKKLGLAGKLFAAKIQFELYIKLRGWGRSIPFKIYTKIASILE